MSGLGILLFAGACGFAVPWVISTAVWFFGRKRALR